MCAERAKTTVEMIVEKMILKGDIPSEHREMAVSELDRQLRVRTKSMMRHMALALEGAVACLTHVSN